MAEHGASGNFMEHFGAGGLHSRAFASGQNNREAPPLRSRNLHLFDRPFCRTADSLGTDPISLVEINEHNMSEHDLRP
jgi:hypothetical protein